MYGRVAMGKKISSKSRRKAGPASKPRRSSADESDSFETLLDEMSSAMARTPAHEVDSAIEQWLREIVLSLDVDRSTVWERSAPEIGFVGTHWWARPGIPKLPQRMASMQISPWVTEQVLSGKAIIYSHFSELGEAEPSFRQFLKAYGPEAQIILPLEIGGSVVAGLTFGKFRGSRQWPPSLV